MLYYTAADKNHWGVLCCKISSSDTATMQKDFGRNNIPDGKTMQHLMAKFCKTGSVADAHKGQHPSFSIILENIQNLQECHEESPTKSTCRLSQETDVSRKSFFRILHIDLKLFPYKIQILQWQTDQNKAEWETFCKDIIQRIGNALTKKLVRFYRELAVS